MLNQPTLITMDKKDQEQTNLYAIKEKTISARVYDVYINSAIASPDNYTDLLCLFSSVSPQDVINIHLNTPGGQFFTALQIIQAIQNCPAKVNTYAEGQICSAGTMILLCGDEIFICKHTVLMFHNYSGGILGKGHEIAAQAQFNLSYFSDFAQEIYYPFLDQEEIDSLINGQDFWMDSEEALDRLRRFAEYKIAESEKRAEEENREDTAGPDPEEKPKKKKRVAKRKPTGKSKDTDE